MPMFRLELRSPVSYVSHLVLGALLLAVAGCSPGPSPGNASGGGGVAAPRSVKAENSPSAQSPLPAEKDAPLPQVPSPYDALPTESRGLLDKPFTGDFDEMVKRRLIRAGVVFNRTQYFIDKGVQRGISYESIKLFEEELNKRLKTGLLKVHVAIVPLSRDQLFPALREGKVDFVAAALTITPERRKLADFSTPTRTDVSEIVVTAPDVPTARQRRRSVRPRSVRAAKQQLLRESPAAERRSLASRGKPPVIIKEAPEALEDDDVLEMVNAGLVDITVVDDFVAEFWQQVFPNIRLHKDVCRADRRGDRDRRAQEQPEAAAGRRTPGSRSTGRARRSATRWSAAICRDTELRQERRPPRRSGRSCSRS